MTPGEKATADEYMIDAVERSDYRITVYGNSMYDAINKLRTAVEGVDRR